MRIQIKYKISSKTCTITQGGPKNPMCANYDKQVRLYTVCHYKELKSFIVNCGFCAWPPTFDNPIPYQYKPFDVNKYIGSWSIVYRCMEWNYNHQTTVFLNIQSFSTETTNPSMPLTAFIFQTTTLYNVAIAQTTYVSD